MKSLFVLLILVMFPVFSCCQAAIFPEVLAYMRANGFTIVSDKYAYLKQGETSSYSEAFSKGRNYIICTGSDDSNVNDTDVTVYNSDGSIYMSDNESSKAATLTFEPAFTRSMTVTMKNYASSTPNSASNIRTVIAYIVR